MSSTASIPSVNPPAANPPASAPGRIPLLMRIYGVICLVSGATVLAGGALIIWALATGSEIVLADEPTGNLDESNTANIVSILAGLAREKGRCVIVVTHDPAVAQQADQVLRMQDGQLVEQQEA